MAKIDEPFAPSKGSTDPIARFNVIYANLPLEERRLAVVVVDDQPISWEMARREINHKTGLGMRILRKLEKLGII